MGMHLHRFNSDVGVAAVRRKTALTVLTTVNVILIYLFSYVNDDVGVKVVIL
jgi:hypothetical protein